MSENGSVQPGPALSQEENFNIDTQQLQDWAGALALREHMTVRVLQLKLGRVNQELAELTVKYHELLNQGKKPDGETP